MIYLPKKQGYIVLEQSDSIDKHIISFDSLMSEVKQGNVSADGIKYYLISLIDIYIDCAFLYEWYLLPNEQKKTELFSVWTEKKRLAETVSVFNHHFTKARFDALSEFTKTVMIENLNELIEGYTEKVIPRFLEDLKTKNINYIISKLFLNTHIQKATSYYLGISSNSKFDTNGHILIDEENNNQEMAVRDFIDGELFLVREFAKPVNIKSAFFSNMSHECLDDFVALAREVDKIAYSEKAGQENKKLDEILQGVKKLENDISSSAEETKNGIYENGNELKECIDTVANETVKKIIGCNDAPSFENMRFHEILDYFCKEPSLRKYAVEFKTCCLKNKCLVIFDDFFEMVKESNSYYSVKNLAFGYLGILKLSGVDISSKLNYNSVFYKIITKIERIKEGATRTFDNKVSELRNIIDNYESLPEIHNFLDKWKKKNKR